MIKNGQPPYRADDSTHPFAATQITRNLS